MIALLAHSPLESDAVVYLSSIGVNLACDTKFGIFDFTYQNELWGIDIIPFFSVPSMTRTNVPPWYDVAQDRNASFVFVNTIVI